jgi:hypothetical protein
MDSWKGEGTIVPLFNGKFISKLKIVNDRLAPPLSKGRLGGEIIIKTKFNRLAYS